MFQKPSNLPSVLLFLTLPTVAEQDSQAKTFNLRVLTTKVDYSEKFAEFLKPLNPDIVLLSEVPRLSRGKKGKDWSDRMADALGLGHVHVVSSANHKAPKWPDLSGNYGGKYKSILSRTPLSNGRDVKVEGSGWRKCGSCGDRSSR